MLDAVEMLLWSTSLPVYAVVQTVEPLADPDAGIHALVNGRRAPSAPNPPGSPEFAWPAKHEEGQT